MDLASPSFALSSMSFSTWILSTKKSVSKNPSNRTVVYL